LKLAKGVQRSYFGLNLLMSAGEEFVEWEVEGGWISIFACGRGRGFVGSCGIEGTGGPKPPSPPTNHHYPDWRMGFHCRAREH